MQLVRRVTIIALLVLAGGLLDGCGSGRVHLGEDAREPGDAAGALGPGGADARVAQALELHRAGDLDGAGKIVQQVLAVEPSHPGALRLRVSLDRTSYCTVYPGDTLSEIAGYYYGDVNRWTVLARANGIIDPGAVKAYARLRVPRFPDDAPGRDELGRLQRKSVLGRKLDRIVVIPAGEGDTLESLSARYYGSKRSRYFLADFNHLEARSGPLAPGTPLKIPVFEKPPPAKPRAAKKPASPSPREQCLASAREAMQNREYEKACACLAALAQSPPAWPEGEALLERCRAEGVSYHEDLGEASLHASEPAEACSHWERALALDPGNERLNRKLQETRDLMHTMESLPDLP